jgi:hypothetical protein
MVPVVPLFRAIALVRPESAPYTGPSDAGGVSPAPDGRHHHGFESEGPQRRPDDNPCTRGSHAAARRDPRPPEDQPVTAAAVTGWGT